MKSIILLLLIASLPIRIWAEDKKTDEGSAAKPDFKKNLVTAKEDEKEILRKIKKLLDECNPEAIPSVSVPVKKMPPDPNPSPSLEIIKKQIDSAIQCIQELKMQNYKLTEENKKLKEALSELKKNSN